MDRPFNVLFLCTGNSARSIMAEAILNKLGAGNFAPTVREASRRGRSIGTRCSCLQSLGYDTSSFRSKSWSEFARPGAPVARFRFYRLRQRRRRKLPGLAGPADDGALGRSRSGRSKGHPSRDRPGVQGCLPDAASAHRRFHGAADPEPRSAQPATTAQGHRPHGRCGGEGERAELMPSLPQRAFCECARHGVSARRRRRLRDHGAKARGR